MMFLASLMTCRAVRTTNLPFHFTKVPLPIERVAAPSWQKIRTTAARWPAGRSYRHAGDG